MPKPSAASLILFCVGLFFMALSRWIATDKEPLFISWLVVMQALQKNSTKEGQ